jgi:2-C-methyl-D-erythritol 2,4-cyclodiphosphate synthase
MGIGFDAHRFARDRKLVLGGVEIPGEQGLAGHSDADVLCHALMDSLLGAVSAGDIGRHFPDTEPRWKNACSLDMLRQVGGILDAAGARIVNLDATVIAERPRLAGYIDAMCTAIAGALGIGRQQVSVKATTVEEMGALGRGEGIAAMAVAAVETGCEREE